MPEETNSKKTEEQNKNIKIVEDATCTFCGCVCDDMELHVDVDEKRIIKAKNACVLGLSLIHISEPTRRRGL